MDRIILEGIEFYAYGGVSEGERRTGQRYRARVELWADLSTAARTDSLSDTVNYARVHDIVVQTVRERPFNLIESVAARAAARLLESFPVEQVTVRLAKLAPPIDGVVEYAAVEITRRRESPA